MIRPVLIKAMPDYHVFIRFSDGVEGQVDLSDLAGQGVFQAWDDRKFFEGVHIGPGRQIRWSDEIELCPDALYLRLTGKTAGELFPEPQRKITNA